MDDGAVLGNDTIDEVQVTRDPSQFVRILPVTSSTTQNWPARTGLFCIASRTEGLSRHCERRCRQ